MFLIDPSQYKRKKYYRQQRKVLFDGKCAYCQKEFANLTLDHFIPRKKGGRENIENLIPACVECNGDKGCEYPDDWFFNQSFFDHRQWSEILFYVGHVELNHLIKKDKRLNIPDP